MNQANLKIKIASTVTAISLLMVCQAAQAGKKSASPYEKLDIFAKVMALIEQSHVENINEENLIVGAIKGMLRSLDPHSSFLLAKEFNMLQEDTEGNFYGVGMEVSIKDDILTVITPIPDSPALAAGILPGDFITQINGQSTANMDIEEAVGLMRGKEGTEVTITVYRTGMDKPFELTLTRAPIEIQSVQSELIEPGFVHLELRAFTDGVSAKVRDHLKQAKLEGGDLKGVVLDLRRNPGGLMYEAVKVSDLFMDDGTIVSTKGRGELVVESFDAHRAGTFRDLQVVVLIDGSSASASEIVAGALQDSGRALLVGTRSFGKGSVQTMIPMRDGSGLKLTTALYYTPSGTSIQAKGIEPDVTVESRTPPSPDDFSTALSQLPTEKELPGHLAAQASKKTNVATEFEDFQLRMAFQILKGLARKQEAAAGKK